MTHHWFPYTHLNPVSLNKVTLNSQCQCSFHFNDRLHQTFTKMTLMTNKFYLLPIHGYILSTDTPSWKMIMRELIIKTSHYLKYALPWRYHVKSFSAFLWHCGYFPLVLRQLYNCAPKPGLFWKLAESRGLFSLTWFNMNADMDKWIYPL